MASKTNQEAGEDDPSKVSFRGHALKVDTMEDAQVVIDQIEKCDELVTLELAGNTFGVEGAGAIAHVLEEKKSLKNCLWSDMFTGRLRSEIPSILSSLCNSLIKANTHLVVLDLSDNAFGPDGIKAVEKLLTSPACYSLQEMYFNNNGLGPGGAILAQALIECHRNAMQAGVSFTLKKFVCGRNRIENERAKPLAEAFKVLKTLEVIRLHQNGIHHAGIADLADSFEHNPNLTEIDLGDNTLTAKGALAISEVLPKLLKLKIVKLGESLSRDEGAVFLAKGFTKEHTNLETVDLQFNEIKTDGAIALTDAISTLPAIKSFNLNGNELGKETIAEVKAKMKAVNRYEVLESFSDDEGDDGSDDDVDDGNEDDDVKEPQDADDKAEDSFVNITEKHEEINIPTVVPSDDQVNAFLTKPSLESLMIIGSNCITVVLDHISRDKDAEIVTAIVVRMSAIWSDCEAEQQRTLLVNIITAILTECTKDNQFFSSQFISYVLTHMGLIKSEDKKFKPLDKLTNILLVLSEIANKGDLSKIDKETLLIFVSKPNPKLLASTTELSILIGSIV